MTTMTELEQSIQYSGMCAESSIGSHPVEAPVIDHEYVRRLEDRNKYLERNNSRLRVEHDFLYGFAAQQIIYQQAGRENTQIQELLDSVEVSLRLTYTRYNEIIHRVTTENCLTKLQEIVRDWNIDDYKEEADE